MKKFLPILLMALLAISLTVTGCMGNGDDIIPTAEPTETTRPTSTPRPTETTTPTEVMTEQPSGSPDTTGDVNITQDANATEGSEGAGNIPDFVEGSIVNPDDVPELVQLLSESSEYGDMKIQSITHKTYEGKQAYCVVLQGEGSASTTVYVLADNSIVTPRENSNNGGNGGNG